MSHITSHNYKTDLLAHMDVLMAVKIYSIEQLRCRLLAIANQAEIEMPDVAEQLRDVAEDMKTTAVRAAADESV